MKKIINRKNDKQKKDDNRHNNDCPNDCPMERETFSSPETLKEIAIKKLVWETFRKPLIKIEILTLLHRNEYYMDTLQNFTSAIKKGIKSADINLVKEILDDLVKTGLVEKMGEGDSAIYSLTTDPNLKHTFQQEMEEILKSY